MVIPQTFRQSAERVAGFGDAGGNLVVDICVRRQYTSEVAELVHYWQSEVTSRDSWSHPSITAVGLQHDFGLLEANSEAKSGCSVQKEAKEVLSIRLSMCQQRTVVSIQKVTNDSSKCCGAGLESSQVEDTAINCVAYWNTFITVLEGYKKHGGEEYTEEQLCEDTALFRVICDVEEC